MIVAIDHHQAGADSGKLRQQIVVCRSVRGGEDDAIDLPAAEHLELRTFLIGIFAELHNSKPYPRTLATGSMPEMIFDEKRVHQIGMTMPMVWVRRSVRLRATALRW
jgi:hypothetical protein